MIPFVRFFGIKPWDWDRLTVTEAQALMRLADEMMEPPDGE